MQAGGQRFESVILHVGTEKVKLKLKVYAVGLLREPDGEAKKSKKGHMADALALGGDEGRDKLR